MLWSRSIKRVNVPVYSAAFHCLLYGARRRCVMHAWDSTLSKVKRSNSACISTNSLSLAFSCLSPSVYLLPPSQLCEVALVFTQVLQLGLTLAPLLLLTPSSPHPLPMQRREAADQSPWPLVECRLSLFTLWLLYMGMWDRRGKKCSRIFTQVSVTSKRLFFFLFFFQNVS